MSDNETKNNDNTPVLDSKKLYYYYARDIEDISYRNRKSPALYVIEVRKNDGGYFASHTLRPGSIHGYLSRSGKKLDDPFIFARGEYKKDGSSFTNTFKIVENENAWAYIPLVYRENNMKHLYLRAFDGIYNPEDPMGLYPPKPLLFRVVTVLGETVETKRKYVKYTMTNREFQVLDINYKEYGYYICDYRGVVSFVKKDMLVSIINRYGATNAMVKKFSDEGSDEEHVRVVGLDGKALPSFTAPNDKNMPDPDVHYLFNEKAEKTNADLNNEIWGPDIEMLTTYVDVFYDLRRSELPIKKDDNNDKALRGFTDEIELYLRALLTNTADKELYEQIKKKYGELKERCNDEKVYKQLKALLLQRPGDDRFGNTEAFEDMLTEKESGHHGCSFDRLIDLYTLSVLPGDVLSLYTSMLLIEPVITQYLEDCGKEFKYRLEGKCCRIKSPSSLYSKLYKRDGKDDSTTDELFRNTKDILRYTVIYEDIKEYCENSDKLLNGLMDKFGGKLEKFRNYWTPYVKGDYKGLNTVVNMPDMWLDMRTKEVYTDNPSNSYFIVPIQQFGFEIQFHTEKSLEVKIKNHILYEKNREKGITKDQHNKNELEMKNNMDEVDAPNDAEFLNKYSNEYIIALKNTISMLQNELNDILELGEDKLRYIDERLAGTNNKM